MIFLCCCKAVEVVNKTSCVCNFCCSFLVLGCVIVLITLIVCAFKCFCIREENNCFIARKTEKKLLNKLEEIKNALTNIENVLKNMSKEGKDSQKDSSN